jgi:hypothetical protein
MVQIESCAGEDDPFKILPPDEVGSSRLGANVSRLNQARMTQLHKRLFEKQAIADPNDLPSEPVPYLLEDFTSMIVDRALTDFFDNQPNASEITRSALLSTGSKTPEELFE